MSKTKFQQDLKVYFPQMQKVYVLGKDDEKLWRVIETMIEMYNKKHYGKVEITYQQGKINHIYQTSNRE